jgi:CubicO group peptidase (beta-lactamase class C family)
MIKYLIANLNESGPLGKALALTHIPRHDAGSDKMEVGMGWHILSKNIIWHNGGTGGFRTFAGFNPRTKTAVVVLTNSNLGADDLGFYILDPSQPLKTPRQSITLDEKTLKEFPGEYEMTPQFRITVTYKDASLFVQATGQPTFELFPESPKKFFLKAVDAQIEFVKNPRGEVDKLLLYQNGSIQTAMKVQ